MKKITLIVTILTILFVSPVITRAQEENSQGEIKYKAKITDLRDEACTEELGEGDCLYFDLEILDGDKKGQTVQSVLSKEGNPRIDSLNYKKGLKVYIVETQVADEVSYYIKEPIRNSSLLTLLVIFVIFVILIGGIKGVSSLIGLLISFLILMLVILPLMIGGTSPILASIFGGSIIMTISVFLSHGFNKKTAVALMGTLISLVITGIFAAIYTKAARLTGFSTDDSTFLLQLIDKPINMQGILLASFIIGGIGILDDITVSQVSTINELAQANPSFSAKELFTRSMKVGRDHIASMVNTLVLAYTGSALPLVMLFIASGAGLLEIINSELVAEEIVRTLVGSIGLILAVPITSVLASKIFSQKEQVRQVGRLRR
jgi:uncharacterized membrane protein